MSETRREGWVDCLRAIAILFVVIGHFYHGDNNVYYLLTGPIKMPLFYFISGYVMKKGKKMFLVIKNQIYFLLIPNFIFSFFPLRLYHAIQSSNVASFLIDYFEITYWFIPSFIITQIFVYFLLEKIKSKKMLCIVSLGMFLVGVMLRDIRIFDILCINTAFTGVLYMIFGYIVKESYDQKYLKPRFGITYLIIYIILFIISVSLYRDTFLDMHSIVYYNIPICFGMVYCGIMSLIIVFKYIGNNKVFIPLSTCGRHTLLIYLMQGQLISVINSRLNFLFPYNANSFVNVFIYSILVCFLGTIISIAVKFVCPWLFGKFVHLKEFPIYIYIKNRKS